MEAIVIKTTPRMVTDPKTGEVNTIGYFAKKYGKSYLRIKALAEANSPFDSVGVRGRNTRKADRINYGSFVNTTRKELAQSIGISYADVCYCINNGRDLMEFKKAKDERKAERERERIRVENLEIEGLALKCHTSVEVFKKIVGDKPYPSTIKEFVNMASEVLNMPKSCIYQRLYNGTSLLKPYCSSFVPKKYSNTTEKVFVASYIEKMTEELTDPTDKPLVAFLHHLKTDKPFRDSFKMCLASMTK